jgi:hypothetical protein
LLLEHGLSCAEREVLDAAANLMVAHWRRPPP